MMTHIPLMGSTWTFQGATLCHVHQSATENGSLITQCKFGCIALHSHVTQGPEEGSPLTLGGERLQGGGRQVGRGWLLIGESGAASGGGRGSGARAAGCRSLPNTLAS